MNLKHLNLTDIINHKPRCTMHKIVRRIIHILLELAILVLLKQTVTVLDFY